jgi:hypothetical protein
MVAAGTTHDRRLNGSVGCHYPDHSSCASITMAPGWPLTSVTLHAHTTACQHGHPGRQGPCHAFPAVDRPGQRRHLAAAVSVQRHMVRQERLQCPQVALLVAIAPPLTCPVVPDSVPKRRGRSPGPPGPATSVTPTRIRHDQGDPAVPSGIEWDRRTRPLTGVTPGQGPCSAAGGGSRIRTWVAFATDLQAIRDLACYTYCYQPFSRASRIVISTVPVMFPRGNRPVAAEVGSIRASEHRAGVRRSPAAGR